MNNIFEPKFRLTYKLTHSDKIEHYDYIYEDSCLELARDWTTSFQLDGKTFCEWANVSPIGAE